MHIYIYIYTSIYVYICLVDILFYLCYSHTIVTYTHITHLASHTLVSDVYIRKTTRLRT